MRSRYSAYAMDLHDYLITTWHPRFRPEAHSLKSATGVKWMRLDVIETHELDGNAATVEFVARFKIGGRAQRLHEISRFKRENGRWFYLNGELRH